MPATEEHIGPFDPIFDPSAADYLSNSPPEEDLVCFRRFFEQLARRGVTKKIERFGHTIYVYTCHHIIQLINDGRRVQEIKPDYI
jgi:hypothetical protein